MRLNPRGGLSGNQGVLPFSALLLAIIISVSAGIAMARSKSVSSFSDFPGKEYPEASDRYEVPYVPTPMRVVRSLLELGGVGPKDFLIDLGSGDGRIVITAAKEYGARGFGVDLNATLVDMSKNYAVAEGVSERVDFFVQDIYHTDTRGADIVTLYLLNEVNLKLRPKLLKELRAGARIVSHDFHMGDWRPDKMAVLEVPKHYQDDTILYLWIVPSEVEGSWRWNVPLMGEEHRCEMDLNQHFQDIGGLVSDKNGKWRIFDAALQGDRVRFSLVTEAQGRMVRQDYSGRVRANTIDGTVGLGGTVGRQRLKWQAKRIR